MKTYTFLIALGLITFFSVKKTNAQEKDDRATILNFKGIQYMSKDSLFYANFRFRAQNRIKYSNTLNDINDASWEARVRRLRMRMDGYLYTPKVSYSIQLAFTRGDQDFDDTGIPNIVRDAMIFYNFTDGFFIGFGQSKLPGNRQRVNSSGQLQFAERSILNAAMNIDRDFGLTFNLNKKIANMPINARFAITTGEGRPATHTDKGLAYTGRVEFLPLGKFTNDGDYSEGDLEREEKPKLSIGAGYSFNEGTTRAGGQIGKYIQNPVDLKTTFADAIFKYAGFAYQVEYMRRDVDNPLNMDLEGNNNYSYKGYGYNQQASYLLNKGYEIAGRYTFLKPHDDIAAFEKQTEVLEAGLTKYMKAHRLKLQLNTNYTIKEGLYDNAHNKNQWGFTFQVEFGI